MRHDLDSLNVQRKQRATLTASSAASDEYNRQEQHDPTQGMQQGNDIGTQYRAGVYCLNEDQKNLALKTKERYQKLLNDSGYGSITTEIVEVGDFYYAEHYHQQYLAKNPDGYCGVDGTGIKLS